MARISETELERLKADVSVQRLAEGRGVTFEKHGESLVGRCCFHDDKTPSFVVTPKKNLWHCLGACRAGGSVIDFVMKAEGVSFRHAVELLREEAVSPVNHGAKESTVRRLPAPVEAAADDATLLQQVVDYYHQRLQQTPAALEYLKKRGLDSAELRAHFKLGFADRTLGLRLPLGDRKDGEALRGRLQRLGVLRESGHEHFNGSVVVPIADASGVVRGLYGRKVTPNLRPGTPLHLYLPGPHRGVFNEACLTGQRTVIVCEALLDALSFWAAGFRCVTSAYGVEGFTPLHLEALQRSGVTQVLIAYDRDDAGDAAAAQLAQRLQGAGLECWRVLFPRGLDANAFAACVKPPASLAFVLRQAQWMGPDSTAKPAPPLQPTSLSPLAASTASAPAAEGKKGWLAAAAPAPAMSPSSTAASEPATAPPVVPPSTPAPIATAAVTPTTADLEQSPGTDADEYTFHFGPRRYRVRGLSKNSTPEALKVNVLVGDDTAFHVDTFDLYQAKARAHFITAASAELRLDAEVVKRDVGHLLLKLEALQEAALKANAEPQLPVLTEAEQQAALVLLRAPDLLGRVLVDFEKCGVVGEETNKLVGYLAAISRKLEEPLAVLIQSSSAAGKSSLMEAVLAFVPDEDKVKYSAMTGQSLFYMGDADLKHKVLAVVEEEGAARASYALKLLQSEGELTIASTGKNPSTGRLETHEYHVEGPTQLFLTTTASELDEELLNRCLVLTVDEDRGQTAAIHRLQREKQTLQGLLARREKEATLKLHQNAQRLLQPLLVTNPFARDLTFLDDRTRTRRDFPKYLTLIRTLALLHQHQRPKQTVSHLGQTVEYIEATLDDVANANRLAAAVLGRTLDELPPQTRRLLHQVEAFVAAECARLCVKRADYRFTRREVREAVGISNSQLGLHLQRLLAFEYLATWRAPKGLVYELLYDGSGKDGGPVLPGLADVDALASAYDAPRAESGASNSASLRGGFGLVSASPPEGNLKPALSLAALSPPAASAAHSPLNGAASSYPREAAR